MQPERCHHRERLKLARQGYWGGGTGNGKRLVVDTPTPCSCWMCGNTRRLGEVTLKERSAFEAWRRIERA